MVHAGSLINGSENSTESFILNLCPYLHPVSYITDSRDVIQTLGSRPGHVRYSGKY